LAWRQLPIRPSNRLILVVCLVGLSALLTNQVSNLSQKTEYRQFLAAQWSCIVVKLDFFSWFAW
jgi:hypothetical protein